MGTQAQTFGGFRVYSKLPDSKSHQQSLSLVETMRQLKIQNKINEYNGDWGGRWGFSLGRYSGEIQLNEAYLSLLESDFYSLLQVPKFY